MHVGPNPHVKKRHLGQNSRGNLNKEWKSKQTAVLWPDKQSTGEKFLTSKLKVSPPISDPHPIGVGLY